MLKKNAKKPISRGDGQNKISPKDAGEMKQKFSLKTGIVLLPPLNAYILCGLLFLAALIISLFTYKDYGVAWDEPIQRAAGEASYNYIFYGNQDLFKTLT